MKLSVMFIVALVLSLSMTDGLPRRAENGGRIFRQHSPDSMDPQTRQIKTRTLCPEHCTNGCNMDMTCI
uniref:Conotoxin ba14a n=1 Tax=Conus bayani TaxID=2070216 RepID=CLEA_CONBY|nr:RecName: Full=Conotoxin ba14a; AltName: Full=Conotoxin ba14.1; Flags: Precursor [Conus bayani]